MAPAPGCSWFPPGLHADPQNFGVAASNAFAFMSSFISSRAAVANTLGKPFIVEETGMDVRRPTALLSPFMRPQVLACMASAALLATAGSAWAAFIAAHSSARAHRADRVTLRMAIQ